MSIGIWQVVLILLIVLIIFGAGKLPRVMGDVAKGVTNFKKGLKEDPDASEEDESTRALGKGESEPLRSEQTPLRSEQTKDEAAKS